MTPRTSSYGSNSRGLRSVPKYQEKKQMSDSHIHWEAGYLAFLTHFETWNQNDRDNLIRSKAVDRKATNHPCVILERFPDSDHCVITPVSAFNATEETGFLPPWKQPWHGKKKAEDFRSFRGSESSSSSSSDSGSDITTSLPFQQLLELRNGRTMPKPRASWIYIQHIFVVPVHLLIPFKKPGQGRKSEPREPRQLTQASLHNLRAHIQNECSIFQKQINALHQLRREGRLLGCESQERPQQQCSSSSAAYSVSLHSHEADQTQPTINPTTYASAVATSPPQRVVDSTSASSDSTSRYSREVKLTSKSATYASAAATTTSQKCVSFSIPPSPLAATRGPWRNLRPAPAVVPATPKSAPASLK
ncbi:hypothetical protein PG987_010782 [Apiospora arundinis]|uniref:Uncharacterized protein n=1 Tax=Apiospora arundinis TaxID=335852 RepID=A0ABR2ISE7_9PEZI